MFLIFSNSCTAHDVRSILFPKILTLFDLCVLNDCVYGEDHNRAHGEANQLK